MKTRSLFLLFLGLEAFVASTTLSSSPSSLESTCSASGCKPVTTCMTVSVCLKHDFAIEDEDDIIDERVIRKKRAVGDLASNLTNPGILTIGVVDVNMVKEAKYALTPDKTRLKEGSISYVIIESLVGELGIDYEIKLASSWGDYDNATGVFSGVLGLVQKKEVDIGIGDFIVRGDRVNEVDFSKYLGEESFSIVMKTPSHISKADSLIAPFRRDVWLLILASCILMGPLLYFFINRLEPLVKHVPDNQKFSMANCYWFVYGALLKQGSSLEPSSDIARILFACWWMFIQVITSFYTAELTAVLTLSSNSLPVNNLDELYTSGKAKWVALKGADMDTLLNSDLLHQLKVDLDNGKGRLVGTVKEAVDLVLAEDNMYFLAEAKLAERVIMDDFEARYSENKAQANQEGCRLSYTRNFGFGNLPYGFVVQKNTSALQTELNDVIGRLSASGIFKHLERMRFPVDDIGSICKPYDDKTLVIEDLISTFLLIVAGFGVSTLALTFELLFPKCLRSIGIGRNINKASTIDVQPTNDNSNIKISVNGKRSTVNIGEGRY